MKNNKMLISLNSDTHYELSKIKAIKKKRSFDELISWILKECNEKIYKLKTN